MAVKLEVIAKPSSCERSGMSSTNEPGLAAWARLRAPSGLQVRIRWPTSPSSRSASSVAAVLSGESPDRAKETSSVGTSCGR